MERQKEYNGCLKQCLCKDCPSNFECGAWVDFVLLHSDIKPYAHFDKKVSLKLPTVRHYVMNNDKIAQHSFYPFIHFTKVISRYGKKLPKKRELYYCSHLDRCVYQRYAFLINQKYIERIKGDNLDTVAIAYRSDLGKNNIDFAKEAFESINKLGHCSVIVGDFTNFFDRLDHSYLKKMLCSLLQVERLPNDYYAVFKNITHFAFWDWKSLIEYTGHQISEHGVRRLLNSQEVILSKEQFKKGKKNIEKNHHSYGIPQGSPISATLSNVYMLEFDKIINMYVSTYKGKYFRYCDDFFIALPYENESAIKKHIEFVYSSVDNIKQLDLQPEKTGIYIFDKGSITEYSSGGPAQIDYLGFVFDGKNIKLRPRSITKYYYRMRRKARHIGHRNWRSPKNKHITAKKLYEIYSATNINSLQENKSPQQNADYKRQTFIDYAKKADKILHLSDKEALALIRYHKRKIAQAIKSGASPKIKTKDSN